METYDAALTSSTSLIVFEAALVNDPSITAKANVYINMLAESRLTTILNKLPDPFFEKIGNRINQPFLIDLKDGKSDEIAEFDLGSLIILNGIGESQVTLEEDGKAPFIKLIRIGNSYKLTIDKSNAKQGIYEKKITI